MRVVAFGDLAPLDRRHRPVVGVELATLFAGADVIVGNCETTVCESPRSQMTSPLLFNTQPARFRETLSDLGIDANRLVLSLANNHAHDLGREGLKRTLESLDRLGIRSVGVVQDVGEIGQATIESGGLQFIFAAWTEMLNSTLPGAGLQSATTVPAFSKNKVEAAKEVRIALPHWGAEFDFYPRPGDVNCARKLLSSGYSAVIGHHPHVPQSLELCENGLCAYSIGNFAFPGLNWATAVFPILELNFPSGCNSPIGTPLYRLTFWTLIEDADRQRIEPISRAPHQLGRRWRKIHPLLYASYEAEN